MSLRLPFHIDSTLGGRSGWVSLLSPPNVSFIIHICMHNYPCGCFFLAVFAERELTLPLIEIKHVLLRYQKPKNDIISIIVTVLPDDLKFLVPKHCSLLFTFFILPERRVTKTSKTCVDCRVYSVLTETFTYWNLILEHLFFFAEPLAQ